MKPRTTTAMHRAGTLIGRLRPLAIAVCTAFALFPLTGATADTAPSGGVQSSPYKPIPTVPVLPGTASPTLGQAGPFTSGAVSPIASAVFPAATYTEWHPPDTMGAVGPHNMMVAENGIVNVQSRFGLLERSYSLNGFFAPVYTPGTGQNTTDPRVLYDKFAERWIVTCTANFYTSAAILLIAVSKTSDPTQLNTTGWYMFTIPTDSDSGGLWPDQPVTGLNKLWVTIQCNMFHLGISGTFARSNIYAISKASLYTGTLSYTPLRETGIGASQSPAVMYDDNVDTEYLVQSTSSSGASGKLAVYTITGSVGSETFSSAVLTDPETQWNFPPVAPQLGGSGLLTFDDRIESCVYRAGSLWCTQNVDPKINLTDPERCAVQWWQIATSSPYLGAVQQFGRLDDSSGTNYYAYGSIAVNVNGDALIGCTRFSAGTHPSADSAFRASGDPLDTLRQDVVYQAGMSTYADTAHESAPYRWGDYSATVVDPNNDLDMWTVQEASDANGNWTTSWGKVGTALKADFSSDGYNDLLLQDTSTGNGTIWEMQGYTVLNSVSLNSSPGTAWQFAGAGDFNGDGYPDLVLQDPSNGQIAVWYMSGTTVSSGVTLTQTLSSGWQIVAVTDINRDGSPDLVVFNASTGEIDVWYYSGTTYLGKDVFNATVPAGYTVVGAGDFNQDGYQDLVLQQASTGNIVLWYFQGVNYQGAANVSISPGTGYRVAGVADYSSDGLPDLILQPTSGTGDLVLWTMNGSTVTAGYNINATVGTSLVRAPR